MAGEFEVRICPLIRGVPDLLETEAGGTTSIAEVDTDLVEQFADVEVEQSINEGTIGRVTLSMHDPLAASLAPFARSVRVGYKRPGESVAEVMLWGAANVTEDYAAETVTLEIQDRSAPLQHHYIRRGDTDYLGNPILNLPDDRGIMRLHPDNIGPILNAAMNTQAQQDREVPALALSYYIYGNQFGDIALSPFTQFERGQECWALIQEFARGIGGPDLIMEPRWTWPATIYGYLTAFDAPTNPASPGANELGANRDPVDPDAPAAGDVVFDLGLGLDNCVALTVNPGWPTTHAHVLDRDKAYRVTSADAASSADIGVYVGWFEVDQTVPRPTNADPDPDLRALQAIADVQVKRLGMPPKHFTLTLRPDDALTYHFGHPYWPLGTPGHFYLGDYVRVRAQIGYRSFSTLARITRVKLKQDGWNGLPYYEVSMIPAVGGSADGTPEDA